MSTDGPNPQVDILSPTKRENPIDMTREETIRILTAIHKGNKEAVISSLLDHLASREEQLANVRKSLHLAPSTTFEEWIERYATAQASINNQ